MRILHTTHLAHLAFILSQLFYSFATGQEQDNQLLQLSQNQPNPSQLEITDFFAGSLMLMNEGTIKMSEIAAKRSSNEEVKSFAKKLSQHHNDLNDRLQKFAPQIARMLDIENKEHTTNFRSAGNSGQSLSDKSTLGKVLKIQKNATENYQQSSNRMIERYEGQDFDMAFLGMQIGAHTWALAELNALETIDNTEFQHIVADSKTMFQQHLEEAQHLSNKFEDDN